MKKMDTVANLELKRILTNYLVKNTEIVENVINNQPIYSLIANVTPSLAESLLNRNTKNRPLYNGMVTKMVNSMVDGEWLYDGTPIIFDQNGVLINGQHRLTALIKAKKTLTFKIEFGYLPSTFSTIDTGRSRSGGDVLTIAGIKFPRETSTTANFIFNFTRNIISESSRKNRQERNTSLSNTQLINFVQSNNQIVESVDFILKTKKKMGRNFKSLVPLYFLTGFHFIFDQKNSELANEFIYKFITGENLSMNSPIYVLRERLELSKISKHDFLNHQEKVKLFVLAWNKYRKNETVKMLKMPEILPLVG